MKKLLVSLMLIISSVVHPQSVTTLDPSQVYSTPNLTTFDPAGSTTTSAWQNVGQWGGQLSCWAPGGPGYCGPNPYVNANGYGMINFSYGYTDLYQIVSIAAALPNSGSGLRVNGFDFSFTAKNGNGWDGGRQDYLAAYVSLYDSTGALTRHYDYSPYTNRLYNWTTFNFSETFQTPYAAKDLSAARYGFVGYDTNFWAGPYGPEIYNVNFSLKYSVDQCAINILSSPTCPGYMDALAKLLPLSTTSTNTATSTSTTPTTTITTTVTDDPTNPTVTVTSTPITATTVTTTPTTVVSPTITATPTVVSTQKSSSSPVNNSLGLSVVAKNQQREQSIVNNVVQSAISSAESSALSSQQESLAIAAAAVSNSVASAVSAINQTQVGTGLRVGSSTSMIGLSVTQSSELSSSGEVTPIGYNNMLTDKTNPLNEYVEHKQFPSSQANVTGPTVNTGVANNELAGGVDITKMALAPAGYADYLNYTLRDASFYAPKEVYKNQANVDNARALRQLTNDARHRELVDSQYGK